VMRYLAERRGVDYAFEIDSAGIGAWHTGQLPDLRMRRCGAARGYVFDHRARQVKATDFEHFDYILGMDEENMSDLAALRHRYFGNDDDTARAQLLCLARFMQHHKEQDTIPDPYYGGQRDFERALDLIEDACEGLLEAFLGTADI